jgi:hypothetical protein
MIAAKYVAPSKMGPRGTLTPLLVYSLLIISTRSRGDSFREIAFTTMIVGDQVLYLPCTNLRFDEEGLSAVGKDSEVGLLRR